MKRLFVIAAFSTSVIACDSPKTNETTVDTDTVTTTNNEVTTTTTYTPSEGDVSYRNGKVVVWKNNDWQEADNDVTLDNGVVVKKNGEVRRDDDVIVLKDGEVVSRTGRFFDRAGNAIENAWDATKTGAKKAGESIENAAEKVGEETKDVFDNDKKDDKK